MEATTALIKYVAEVRESIGGNLTPMEVIRQTMQKASERKGIPELQLMLSAAQRKLMSENLECIEGFLKSEDGADAWELLVASFKHYVDRRNAPAEEVGVNPVAEEDLDDPVD